MGKVDIVCFGAHPDDVEIGMAGTIFRHYQLGYKIAVCDLTLAELSSNGTVEQRQQEATNAAQLMGAEHRYNLRFPDRGLIHDEQRIRKIVELLRRLKPRTVFVPYEKDRHPDHGSAARLVKDAVFSANIRKYEDQANQPAHRVEHVFHYFINNIDQADLIFDISDVYPIKEDVLKAYKSQFIQQDGAVATRLNTGFLDTIRGRDAVFGKMIQVAYGEAFMQSEPLPVSDMVQLSGVSKNE